MSNTFCVLPWINLSTDVNGSLRPCCKFAQPNVANEYQLPNMRDGDLDQLWNDDRFQALRQAFIDSKKPKECQSCWDEEAAGIKSFRIDYAKNKRLDLRDVDFKSTTSKSPMTLDLKLNNVCNLKCRICGPQASSAFVKEYEERLGIKLEDSTYWLSNKISGLQNEKVLLEWASGIKHIDMTGGEPMVSPENTKILEILIHSGYASQISLMLNTNGTQYNKKFIDLLTQFKVVKICLSIDDIFERIEYQRYPSEWAKIEVNVKKFISLQATHKNVFINLTPTVSVFNVFYLNEYLDWTKTIDYSFMYFNILHYDPCYSIKNLPLTIKKILLEKLTDPALSSVINFLNLPGDANIFNQFYENVRVLDEHRNQKFSVIFPQWENLLRTHINE